MSAFVDPSELITPRTYIFFSPARAAFGVLIEALDAFLAGHPGDRDLARLEYWL